MEVHVVGGPNRRKEKSHLPVWRRTRGPTPIRITRPPKLRGDFRLLDHLGLDGFGRLRGDRDEARLLGFRNLAYEIDVKESVLKDRALDEDMVGELEAALEGASGNALIEDIWLLFTVRNLLLATDGEGVLLHLDAEVFIREARDSDRDAIVVLAGPLDVIGRIGRRAVDARRLVEQREKPVKADGGTIEGGKIKLTHSISS
ncbi:hypothetical protein CHELA20_52492 [Hyphomicrobiales bacterium]|nr:hypothetical protein CHELA41_22432 [Hyphomicrobiales bacterium]CAH1682032.1 hypothetical protein CHELA20_52492 [Hyphomicrobiales bacterium]